jgi:hypothetical protein
MGEVVGWKSRALDAASLGLLLLGGFLYFRAYIGMQQLRVSAEAAMFVPGTTEAFASLNQFARLRSLSYLALMLAVTGIGMCVYAAMHARAIRRRRESATVEG